MQMRRTGKNIELKLLSKYIEDFFKDRGFKIRKDVSAEGYLILGRHQRDLRIYGEVSVRVIGNQDDFVIEFLTSKHASSAVKLGSITSIFGGGSLILWGLKSQEALEKLEKEFWVYIEEAITRLTH
jgi:hypothetical protein